MRTEIVIGLLFVAALVMRVFLIPGGELFLVVTLSLLAFLYFPFAFYFFSVKTLKNQNIFFSIAAGFFMSILPIGILFKLMYWNGAENLLIVGVITGCIFLVLSLVLQSNNATLLAYYRNMVKRTSVLLIVSVAVLFLPTSMLLNFQYRHDPELARLKIQAYGDNGSEEHRHQLQEYEREKKSQE